MAAVGVGNRETMVANTPNEQDPMAKRKINCHRTVQANPSDHHWHDNQCPFRLKAARGGAADMGFAV